MSGPPSAHSGGSGPQPVSAPPQQVPTASNPLLAPSGLPPAPEQSLEQIASQGARLARFLRESVGKTFELVSEPSAESREDNSGPTSAHDVKEQLAEVQKTFDHLEKISTTNTYLARHVPPNQIMHENLQNLLLNGVQDPVTSDQLASDLFDSYSWSEKIKEFTYYGSEFIRPMVKKNYSRFHRKMNPQLHPVDDRLLLATLEQFSKQLNFLKLSVVECTGNKTLLLIDVVQRYIPDPEKSRYFQLVPVMKTGVVLRGYVPDWINVKGPDEDFKKADGKVSLSEKSKHEVFRKLSDNLKGQLMAHYGQVPTNQKNALVAFLPALQKFRFLFSEPCKTCKKFLKNHMPPYCIDIIRSGPNVVSPVHDSCKPF